MKVNLATQVHSHSVFAGISGMCDIGISAENNRSTAVFIKQIIPLVLSKTIFCCWNRTWTRFIKQYLSTLSSLSNVNFNYIKLEPIKNYNYEAYVAVLLYQRLSTTFCRACLRIQLYVNTWWQRENYCTSARPVRQSARHECSNF